MYRETTRERIARKRYIKSITDLMEVGMHIQRTMMSWGLSYWSIWMSPKKDDKKGDGRG